jgi:hypothetical protein
MGGLGVGQGWFYGGGAKFTRVAPERMGSNTECLFS